MLAYDRNGVQLYRGDCADILPTLPKADLILTSPPYDAIREYGGQGFDFQRCAAAIAAALTEGGVMCWHTNDMVENGGYTGSSFDAALWFMREGGLRLHDRIIYHKQGNLGAMAHNRWFQNFDFVWVFSNGKPRTFNPIMDVIGRQRMGKFDGRRL